MPLIEPIWHRWWQLDSPGKAISALMYASCLIYWENENPVFGKWTKHFGGGVPYIGLTTLKENRLFLKRELTVKFIVSKAWQAAKMLRHEPEGMFANQIALDARQRQDVIALQIDGLE